jgi:aminoethylphosphonate catabolism LysR family transcriptional regulator
MRHAQLRAFHAVAATGGFSKAAERLGLSQPAVSDHVRHLEQDYGVQLFIRDRRSVTLTVLGRELYAIAERQFEVEGEAAKLLSAAQELDAGELVLAADAAMHVLPLVARFLVQYPQLGFALRTGNSATALNLLDSFQADFAVVAEEPVGSAYITRLLRRDPMVAFVARDHALGGRRRIGLADLAGGALVVREGGSVTRQMLDGELARRGIAQGVRFEIEGREAVREAVAAGLGAGIVSKGEFVADPRLHMIVLSDWDTAMGEWLVCLEARRDLHVIDRFLAMVDAAGSH